MTTDDGAVSPQTSPEAHGDNRPASGGADADPPTAPPTDTRTLARWAVGMAAATGRYLFMRVPLYRRDRGTVGGFEAPDLNRDLPGDPATVQRADDGVGALFHRRYWIDVTDTRVDAEGLIDTVARHLDDMAPTEVSSFEHTQAADGGADGDLRVGDELVVRLIGPWDGPVRVVDRTARSFTFVTLRGHMEAGEITFRTSTTDRGLLRFEIDSWARAGDRRFDYIYDHVPLAREAQLLMWSHFCQRAAVMSGGVVMSNVSTTTDRYEWDPQERRLKAAHTTAPLGDRALRKLPELALEDFNFDPDRPEVEEHGWHIDDYRGELPGEDPGEPAEGGPWWTARRILEGYSFADPAIVRAAYYPDEPLDGRNMVLEGRFLGLRFVMGLRICQLLDDEITVDGRPVRRFGWSYRTLGDHLEMGEMDYAVWKWTDTGEVEFRVHAFSKPAPIANPVVRMGFALFGRTVQIRFARRAVARLQSLVERELADIHHQLVTD